MGESYTAAPPSLNQVSAENRFVLCARRGPRFSVVLGVLKYLGGRSTETLDGLAALASVPRSTFARYLRAARAEGCVERDGRALVVTRWGLDHWRSWGWSGGFLRLDADERGAVSLGRKIRAELFDGPLVRRGWIPSAASLARDMGAHTRSVERAIAAGVAVGSIAVGGVVRKLATLADGSRRAFQLVVRWSVRGVPVQRTRRESHYAGGRTPSSEKDPARSFQPGRVARSAKQGGPQRLGDAVATALAALLRPG